MNANVKRLIEVDLPIKRISEHARKEKNMRTGHPWHPMETVKKLKMV